MRVVHKFPLVIGLLNTFELPVTAEIMFVGSQNGMVCIWAFIDSTHPAKERAFKVFPTGASVPELFKPVGTAFDGPYVWHVFELSL